MQTSRTPDAAPLDGGRIVAQLRSRGLLDVAAHESDEMVRRAAERIHQTVDATRRELLSLKTQVDAALGLIEGSASPSGHQQPRPHTIEVSREARRALEQASNELERLLSDITVAPSAAPPALRLRIRPAAAAGALILATAAGLGIATGWLAAAPSALARSVSPVAVATTGRPSVDAPVEPLTLPRAAAAPAALDRTAASDPRAAEAPLAPAADGADDPNPGSAPAELRRTAEAWLHAYFERGDRSAGSPDLPVVRDERPSDRPLPAGVRRVVAPARIGVFGDAAVLSTSVTEYAPSGEVVTLVAQLWTRRAGQWHLDDVRLVSASRAADAFTR